MANKSLNYKNLHQELESIIESLQSADLELDKAVKQYERGMELVSILEKYLKDTKNTVTNIKSKHLK